MSNPLFYPAPGWMLVQYDEVTTTASGLHLPSSASKSVVDVVVIATGVPPVTSTGEKMKGYDFEVGNVLTARKNTLVPTERVNNLFLLRHNDVLGSFEA